MFSSQLFPLLFLLQDMDRYREKERRRQEREQAREALREAGQDVPDDEPVSCHGLLWGLLLLLMFHCSGGGG